MQNLIHIGRYSFIPESKLSTNINFKFQFRQNHLKPKQSTYYALHFFVLVPRNFTTKNSSRGKQAKKSRNLLVKNVLKNSTIFDSYEFWEKSLKKILSEKKLMLRNAKNLFGGVKIVCSLWGWKMCKFFQFFL